MISSTIPEVNFEKAKHVKQFQFHETWMHALALCEISFILCLTASDDSVSQKAAEGLALIVRAESRRGAPKNPGISDAERARKSPVYSQMGDGSVKFIGW